jgi:signal transduction histidine kinase
MSSHSTRRSRKFRGTRLRTKVIALLVSLVALWAFAAFVTLRGGLNLLWVSTLTERVGRPTESLVAALQQERRLSVVYQATPAATDRSEQRRSLAEQRQRTDEAVATFKRLTTGSTVSSAASDTLESRLGDLSKLLDGLPRQRATLDANTAGNLVAVAGSYTQIIDAGFRVYGSISALDDPDIAKQASTLIALSRARETLSQEDALLAGVLAAGRFAGTEHAQFTKLVGVQRFAYAEAAADLPSPERDQYNRLVAGDALTNLRSIEDRVVETGRTGAALPVSAPAWTAAVDAAAGEFRAFELASAELTLQRATPAAIGVVVRLLLAGGLGLVAVIASIIISITTARSLLRQLVRLRNAARELANERLPSVVEQLRRGETVDVKAQAPPLEFGVDEIGQVGQAFNAVQETAVRVAVEQAELRKSVRDVFVSLARRTQTLVHRQLKLLDTMERKETSAEELAVLFRVDHLATRMRRNAENLIVLSGAVPGRTWRQPVPMVDVVRGASAEIEEYTRVNVFPIPPAGLVGRVVGDVIHLLAELIENATTFSPPHTMVQVGGQLVANGFAVEIEDRGLGMSDSAFAIANEQVHKPPEFQLSSNARLGLYVVGRLAARHGIRVQLRPSPYGGTTAIVLIPSALVVQQTDDHQIDDRPALSSPAATNGDAAGHAEPAIDELPPRPDPGAWPPVRRTAAAVLGANGGPPVPAAAVPATPQAEFPATAQRPVPATVFGLPRRVRTTSRQDGAVAEPAAPSAGETKIRTPEEVRTLMTSHQTGTRRARSDARSISEQAAGEALSPTADEPVAAAQPTTAPPPDEQR